MGATLRELADTDGPALAELLRASPDTGAIQFSPRYKHDPVASLRALRPDTISVVAEVDGKLVGAGHASFGSAEIEGELQPYGLLNTLVVHPDHRRRGIAGELTRWRLERVRQKLGGDAVILANIQTGNAGSFANAGSWATQIFGNVVTSVHRTLDRRPRERYDVREPVGEEWQRAADVLASFETGWNLRQPETGETLRTWAAAAPFGERYRYVLVAFDRDGTVVAGAKALVQSKLLEIEMSGIPARTRAVNAIFRSVPGGRVMRYVMVNRIWFAPGLEDAARSVWDSVRWSYREQANTVLTWFDARGPVAGILPLRPWTPKTVASVAARSPVALREDKLLAPLL